MIVSNANESDGRPVPRCWRPWRCLAWRQNSALNLAGDSGGPAITRIGQIGVPINDLDRAVAFYRDVLGLQFLFQAPPGLAFFACGGVRLMLSGAEAPEHDHPASVIYYMVDDLAASWAAVTARGRLRRSPSRT